MIAAVQLFRRLILRTLFGERLRTALTVFAVALGVGVVVAIELAGAAAAGSFHSSIESLAGDADVEITAIGGVTEDVLGALVALPSPLRVSPRIEGFAIAGDTGVALTLVGLDLLHHEFAADGGDSRESLAALRDPASIWVGAALGHSPGDSVSLTVNDRTGQFTVQGLLASEELGRDRLVVMDIRVAQTVLGREGRLDRIEVGLPPGAATGEWIERLRGLLPEGVDVRPQGARTEENRKMLSAFRWNLRVLSYISLIVGAFLIYNTIAVSVVRRRAEIGVLRALGATRSRIVAAFLAEAAFFGITGAAAGVALGRVMAGGAVQLLAATVESLYVSSTPAPIEVTAPVIALALGIGVVVSLLSALAPALEASRVTPVEAMSRGRRDYAIRIRSTRDLAVGLALAVAAGAATRLPPVAGKPLFGYLAALLLIAASALAIPALVTGLSRIWRRALAHVFGVEAMLASRGLAASLGRTAVLVGALSTAVAMMTSVGIMVGSFRETVALWLDNQLRADLYVRPVGGGQANRHPVMAPELADRIEDLPGVAAVDRFRLYDISYKGLPALLGAGQTEWIVRYGRTSFLPGQDREAILRELPRGDNVIVSEPFSNKHGVWGGDTIELPLGDRRAAFRVLGVYRDFSNERGYIIMDRQTMLRHRPDRAASSLAVFLDDGADIDRRRDEVERACAGHRVTVFTNRSLRAHAMRIFDRTFAITYALEAVAVAVAVMGIAGALLALVIDRKREMAVLRFLGASVGQVRRLILFEAGLLGLLANLIGVGLGLALSLVLIFVINKQSFGWTIEFHTPIALLVAALTAVYSATVLAGLYPARVAARLNPIEVVHEE